MLKNRDIIIVGQQPWDTSIGSNCKDLAVEFSKNNRVLYVNAPLDRRTAYQQRHDNGIKKRKRIIDGQEDGLQEIAPNFWVYYPDVIVESINWIKFTSIFRVINKINNKRFAKSIKAAIDKLDFKNFILFNDNDVFKSYHLKELLSPSISIYYSRDYIIATPYWARHGKTIEPELIEKSDLCVANSVYLANYCKQYNPNSFYVGQGCDFEMFKNDDSIKVPEDLHNIQKPILGYVGALLSIRLDENILIHLAETKPNWNIVLVGPEDEDFKRSRLHQLKNVHFLGAKKPETLPAYIKGFDICLNPQGVNPLTIGNYPRKIDEYLAMGKPTLATKTEAISIFKDYIYIAETKEDYVQLAEKALAENNIDLANDRITFANTHTWEKNAEEIYKAIDHVAEHIELDKI
ncbi:glycosyltransferase family 1 protein [Pedobacter frigiditerrae]|uniref:Glycosyltransferase family 1 protein n=1 Tax=Pedobacter frigiditerrae TaxID=2530452 RepID=A0A4V2MJE4_9SPHI|nr:glycosyltransferase [Pedobacter frigiditerrae]TCC93956.1 glycosyltransferase family 1 protein [Pedobacter frigiditerrae]